MRNRIRGCVEMVIIFAIVLIVAIGLCIAPDIIRVPTEHKAKVIATEKTHELEENGWVAVHDPEVRDLCYIVATQDMRTLSECKEVCMEEDALIVSKQDRFAVIITDKTNLFGIKLNGVHKMTVQRKGAAYILISYDNLAGEKT